MCVCVCVCIHIHFIVEAGPLVFILFCLPVVDFVDFFVNFGLFCIINIVIFHCNCVERKKKQINYCKNERSCDVKNDM